MNFVVAMATKKQYSPFSLTAETAIMTHVESFSKCDNASHIGMQSKTFVAIKPRITKYVVKNGDIC